MQELEAKITELTALVEKAAPATAAVADDEPRRASRRHMLKLAGAAAAGATAAAVSKQGQAAAADGDAVTVGETRATTPTEDDSTVVVYTNSAAPTVPGPPGTTLPANLFLVRDEPAAAGGADPNSSANAAAVAGASHRTVPNGVYGLTQMAGAGVLGEGAGIAGVYGRSTSTTPGAGAGVRARSESGPTVQLEPVLTAAPSSGTWARGAIVADTAGRLWYNTTGGTPGTWVNLAQTYRAVTPFRVYDSREPLPAPGRISTGETRTITIKDQRAILGGAVTLADALPAGVVAVTANVTVVDTIQSGYLTVNPGGDSAVNAATVNWSASGQILNNGVNVTINPTSRQVTVIAGGIAGSSTHFVIDVTGYFV
jgi:hypothetical protein